MKYPGKINLWRQEVHLQFPLLTVIFQLLSRVRLFVTPQTAAHPASLSFTISRSLLELMCIESVMPSNHLFLCPLLLLPLIFPSIRVFSNESALCILDKVLELQLQLQHQSFQGIFRINFLQDGLVGSPCSPRDSQESSPKPQFENTQSSLWFSSHIHA